MAVELATRDSVVGVFVILLFFGIGYAVVHFSKRRFSKFDKLTVMFLVMDIVFNVTMDIPWVYMTNNGGINSYDNAIATMFKDQAKFIPRLLKPDASFFLVVLYRVSIGLIVSIALTDAYVRGQAVKQFFGLFYATAQIMIFWIFYGYDWYNGDMSLAAMQKYWGSRDVLSLVTYYGLALVWYVVVGNLLLTSWRRLGGNSFTMPSMPSSPMGSPSTPGRYNLRSKQK